MVQRRPWLGSCLILAALCIAGGCVRQANVPALDGLDWDEQALFQAGLVEAEQLVLDEQPGATHYHIELRVPDDLAQIEAHQEMHYTNCEDVPLDSESETATSTTTRSIDVLGRPHEGGLGHTERRDLP